jgi:hypothetical protein
MGRDPEEDRKKITTIAKQGSRVALMDNLSGVWGTPIVEELLTLPDGIWMDRILGQNEAFVGPCQTVWVATANNVRLRGDLPRRVCYIRLEGPEDPENRSFREKNLLSYVIDNREEIYNAFLILALSWMESGMGSIADIPPWGSYESWTDVVRKALIFSGLRDPYDCRAQTAATSEVGIVRELIAGIAEVLGDAGPSTAGEIADIVWGHAALIGGKYEMARSALIELHPKNKDPQNAVDIGRILTKYRGRVSSGISLQHLSPTSRKWAVELA